MKVSEISTKQIEYLKFQDGILRVVHDEPLPPRESFRQAAVVALEHLADPKNYRLYAKDPNHSEAPTWVLGHEPHEDKIAIDSVLAKGNPTAVLGSVAFLGTSLN